MDPTLFIAGLSATLQAIQTWFQVRDSSRASQVFEDRLNTAQNDASVAQQARQLTSLIPPDVLDIMSHRAQDCWERYRDVLKGDFLPGEIDEATENVKKCLCRELKRIADLNGGNIPPGDRSDMWTVYCVTAGATRGQFRTA